MAPRNLVRSFVILWSVVAVVLLIESVRTVLAALPGGPHGVDPHAILVGGVEAVAAVLFLVPRTMRLGGWGLLATIAIATIAHSAAGQWPLALLVDAAAVAFVMVHGPVPLAALRSPRHP